LPTITKQESSDPGLVISITRDDKLVLNSEPVSKEELKKRLTDQAAKNPDTAVIVRADSSIPHGRVVEIMELTKSAGLRRLAIAVESKE